MKKNITPEELLTINPDTPLEEINDPFLKERKISLFIKREDLLHPEISGNKWYKLKYNIQEALNQNKHTILTFGGAYSNHIYALSTAGKIFGFKTIGIIRGEEHVPLNSTLSFAKDNGMLLYYLDRSSYKKKESTEIINFLKNKFGDFYLLPEGGTNDLAVKGCSEIINKINIDFDFVCCPCATGGTLAGLVSGLNGKNFALGFTVLKGANLLKENVAELIKNYTRKIHYNWNLIPDYHFGGYAKVNKQLTDFVHNFSEHTKIPIEPIYTGKMLFGIYDLAGKGYFKEGSRIVAIHSGGLQGLKGILDRNYKNKR